MGIDAQMLVRNPNPLTEREVRALSFDLTASFGHSHFAMGEDWGAWDGDEKVAEGRHALQIISKYTQDGDDIKPKRGEQFIEVHLWTRYYGEGYERGDIGFIINVASWLEHRIPGASIWYGGDSSGVEAEPFDAKARAKVWAHFCKVGHRPYVGGFDSIFDSKKVILCDFCGPAMTASGGGRDRTFKYCEGCGKKVVVMVATGEVRVVPKGKDFFDMRDEPRTA